MPVLKKDGTTRSPRRTKAQMSAQTEQHAPTCTSTLDECYKVLRDVLGCTKQVTQYRHVNPDEPDTKGSHGTCVWWENGAVKSRSHTWGVEVWPNFTTDRVIFRVTGDKKNKRMWEYIGELADKVSHIRSQISEEHTRVHTMIGAGGVVKDDAPADAKVKLVFGETDPPKKGGRR